MGWLGLDEARGLNIGKCPPPPPNQGGILANAISEQKYEKEKRKRGKM
jgi:hypothetical protein